MRRTSSVKTNNFRRNLVTLVNIGEIEAHFFFENYTFRRKFVKLRRTNSLKTGYFRRKFVKFCEIEAHSLFEDWPFPTKITENWWNWGALLIWKRAIFDDKYWKTVKLRRTPYLKTGKFRRQFVKICEIEAHSLFENLQFSTKISEN